MFGSFTRLIQQMKKKKKSALLRNPKQEPGKISLNVRRQQKERKRNIKQENSIIGEGKSRHTIAQLITERPT